MKPKFVSKRNDNASPYDAVPALGVLRPKRYKHPHAIAEILGLPVVKRCKRSADTLAWFNDLKPSVKKKFATYGTKTFLARSVDNFKAAVPVVITTVPELPFVISIGKNVFIKIGDAPLTYHYAAVAKAKRLQFLGGKSVERNFLNV